MAIVTQRGHSACAGEEGLGDHRLLSALLLVGKQDTMLTHYYAYYRIVASCHWSKLGYYHHHFLVDGLSTGGHPANCPNDASRKSPLTEPGG